MPLEKPGTPEELIHFGVRGMKWGIRKSEETSDSKVSSFKPGPVRQKLIKYHTNVAKKQQESIDYLNAHPGSNFYTKRVTSKTIRQRETYRDQHLKDIKNLQEGHLTDFQKKALIGAGITVAVLGAYGAYKLHDSRGRQFIQTGDKIIGIPFKRNDLLSRKMTSKQIMTEVVPQINPGFGTPGKRMNCLRCSFAYELRRRGFDVEASAVRSMKDMEAQNIWGQLRAMSGASTANILDFASRLGQHKIVTSPARDVEGWIRGQTIASDVFKSLSRLEEGARGELGMSWRMGGAHSVSWEVIAGKVQIFDTQTGQHFQTPEEFQKYARNIAEAAYTRLDDIDIDERFLTNWVRNVK